MTKGLLLQHHRRPGETWDDFRQTGGGHRSCAPDGHYVYIFFPYPGTDLFARCQEQGLLKGSWATSGSAPNQNLPSPGLRAGK